jgi:hypothetical protein
LGLKSKADLEDVAHALELKLTNGNKKLTKKDILERIKSYFNSNTEKLADSRFVGLFNG